MSEAQERFDLFAHENQVLQCDDEEVYSGPWPVRIYLYSFDFHDGNGAKIDKFEQFGEVIDYYETGEEHHEYTTYAVLLEVASAEDFLRLDKAINYDEWANFSNDCYERPN